MASSFKTLSWYVVQNQNFLQYKYSYLFLVHFSFYILNCCPHNAVSAIKIMSDASVVYICYKLLAEITSNVYFRKQFIMYSQWHTDQHIILLSLEIAVQFLFNNSSLHSSTATSFKVLGNNVMKNANGLFYAAVGTTTIKHTHKHKQRKTISTSYFLHVMMTLAELV